MVTTLLTLLLSVVWRNGAGREKDTGVWYTLAWRGTAWPGVRMFCMHVAVAEAEINLERSWRLLVRDLRSWI